MKKKILLYGYGNPGRQDDALGVKVVDKIEEWSKVNNISNITFDSNYQLNIEDADNIKNEDIVFFMDASIENIEDFIITKIDETVEPTFTSHAASPAYIVQLCEQIYNRKPISYLVHIKGYEWELKEGLTDKAQENFDKVIKKMKELLLKPELIDKNLAKVVSSKIKNN